MAKHVYWLSDAEWRRIEPLLPRGRKGAHWVDDRRVISGIVYMLRCGARWRDCPDQREQMRICARSLISA
jgi:transposase